MLRQTTALANGNEHWSSRLALRCLLVEYFCIKGLRSCALSHRCPVWSCFISVLKRRNTQSKLSLHRFRCSLCLRMCRFSAAWNLGEHFWTNHCSLCLSSWCLSESIQTIFLINNCIFVVEINSIFIYLILRSYCSHLYRCQLMLRDYQAILSKIKLKFKFSSKRRLKQPNEEVADFFKYWFIAKRPRDFSCWINFVAL